MLAGIDRADSVTLDPHKWLYQPMECGCVLIRDGARLERTFAIHPDYLDSDATQGAGEVNFADRGLQLSRGFRALKVWVTVHTFGLAAFRAAIQRNLELAEHAETLIRSHPELTLMAPATLGIVCFRREWPGCDEAETERRGTALAEDLERSGTALVSTTRLAGRHAIRLCILNPTSSEEHVRRVIEHFAARTCPCRPGRGGAAYADSRADVMADPDNDVLRAVPLLSGVPDSTVQAVHARGVCFDVAAGEEVIRRWDSDRFFYIVLSGRYDVFIDARLIRTMGPGDHFGELAARDWGGGYGYARLATVRCAEPGRLLKIDQRGLPVADRHRTDHQGQTRRSPGRTPPAKIARRTEAGGGRARCSSQDPSPPRWLQGRSLLPSRALGADRSPDRPAASPAGAVLTYDPDNKTLRADGHDAPSVTIGNDH